MDINNLTFLNSQYGPLDLDKGSDIVDITGYLLCKLQVLSQQQWLCPSKILFHRRHGPNIKQPLAGGKLCHWQRNVLKAHYQCIRSSWNRITMLKAQLIPHLDQMSHSIKTQRVGIFIYSFPAKNQRCEPTNRVTTVAVSRLLNWWITVYCIFSGAAITPTAVHCCACWLYPMFTHTNISKLVVRHWVLWCSVTP